MAAKIADIVMIEDSPTQAALASAMLKGEPCRLHLAGTAAAGFDLVTRISPDAILLDINLPDGNGLTVLDRLRAAGNTAAVVMVTGDSEITTVVDCMRRGAFDYVAKPYSAERIRITVRNAIERGRMARMLESYRAPYDGGFHGMIGTSPAMVAVYRMIEAAATTGAPVFITGESGTGKELAAEAIHRLSPRIYRPLIALNCAALPETLAESELFGHVRGAFTDAHADHVGAVETAAGGTLFLDEIGEMAPSLQAKLLRFLQSGVYRRVGDERQRFADVRIISATNRDPREMIRKGTLREDLYYRLHVIPLRLPSLGERGDDIIEIARHLLARYAAQELKAAVNFSPEAENWMRTRNWPGNVRELENAIRYATVMGRGGDIGPDDLAAAAGGGETSQAARRTLSEIEREAIEAAISANAGNVSEAARQLHIDASTIHRKRRSWQKA